MQEFWNNAKAFVRTVLLLMVCHAFYHLGIRTIFSQSLFVVFSLGVLLVFILRIPMRYVSVFWLLDSFKKSSSIFMLKWIIPVFTWLVYAIPWFFKLVQDVWQTSHPTWAKISVIVLFYFVIQGWISSVLFPAYMCRKAKEALKKGLSKFEGEYEVSEFT
jgi:hypothetical protein